ncbi:MAG: dephospho-CoA kinase [Ruminococcus sp.]|nr:dephospho-CoA kinase [Ruminococcus sp.]
MSNKGYTVIGLTGPTGSGKTLVSSMFAEKGFAVVNADEVAHKALLNPEYIEKLTEAFGEGILLEDGSVSRPALAEAAFSSKKNTELLNRISHPLIIRMCKEEFEHLYEEGFERILFDAPTLFESEGNKLCAFTIAVLADDKTRLSRIMARDNITPEQAKSRMKAQKSYEFYSNRADFVIMNEGDIDTLRRCTEEIIKELQL